MDQEHGATQGTEPVPMLSILQGGFVAYLEHVATYYPQSVSSGSTPSYEALQDFVAGFDPNSRASTAPLTPRYIPPPSALPRPQALMSPPLCHPCLEFSCPWRVVRSLATLILFAHFVLVLVASRSLSCSQSGSWRWERIGCFGTYQNVKRVTRWWRREKRLASKMLT